MTQHEQAGTKHKSVSNADDELLGAYRYILALVALARSVMSRVAQSS